MLNQQRCRLKIRDGMRIPCGRICRIYRGLLQDVRRAKSKSGVDCDTQDRTEMFGFSQGKGEGDMLDLHKLPGIAFLDKII